MTEIVNETPGQEAPETTETVAAPVDPFNEASWVEVPAAGEDDVPRETTGEENKEVKAQEGQESTAQEAAPKEEAPAPWYQSFGYDSEEAAKAEIEALRAQKDQPPTPAEIAFANEQSRQFFDYLREGKEDEVYKFLEAKRRFAAVDAMPAPDALRLHLEAAHPHYSAEDVADIMEERYALPPAPVRDEYESDQDWAQKETAYQTQVQKVQRRMERDAVGARQELQKLNQQLVLPEIPGRQAQASAAPAQSSAEVEAARQTYLSTLDRDYQKFAGFNAVFKDEEVEIPVQFQIDPTEKAALHERLRNFDVDGFILSRWFTPEGQPNAVAIAEDVYLLENRGRVTQKLVQDAVNQRLVHERKKAANIKIGGDKGTFQPEGNHMDELARAIFSA